MACPRAARPFDGAPRPGADGAHHAAMAALAGELQRIAAGFAGADGAPLRLRVGISSGPVAGAVIGQHRRFYCLYGDTVNTAARMCSHAARAVHVSAAFARAAAGAPPGAPRVGVRSRGPVLVKGKGVIETFEVTPPSASAAAAAANAAAFAAAANAAAAAAADADACGGAVDGGSGGWGGGGGGGGAGGGAVPHRRHLVHLLRPGHRGRLPRQPGPGARPAAGRGLLGEQLVTARRQRKRTTKSRH